METNVPYSYRKNESAIQTLTSLTLHCGTGRYRDETLLTVGRIDLNNYYDYFGDEKKRMHAACPSGTAFCALRTRVHQMYRKKIKGIFGFSFHFCV